MVKLQFYGSKLPNQWSQQGSRYIPTATVQVVHALWKCVRKFFAILGASSRLRAHEVGESFERGILLLDLWGVGHVPLRQSVGFSWGIAGRTKDGSSMAIWS